MIKELSTNGITSYIDRFPGPQPHMLLASIAAGNTRGQLWRAGQAEGGVLLLWDKGNNVFYLSGTHLSEEIASELVHLIHTEIKAETLEAGRPYFQVRVLTGAGQSWLDRLFQRVTLYRRTKRFYRFNQSQVAVVPQPTLPGVQFRLIDTGLLEQDSLQNLQEVKAEVKQMWPSLDRFGEKGFGTATLLEETVIGWCTAEYMSETQCGIGIATVEEFENKGIATAMAVRFVDHSLRHHLTPHWECDGENIGSIRVAEKSGFEPLQEIPVWVGMFQ